MSRKDVTLLQSLIDYVEDVKPYHTKFRDVTSEILFNDKLNVNVREDYTINGYLQNVWSRDDVGGYALTNMSEGIELDKTYRLPPAIFPRFSLNDSLNYGQTPPGDDPATLDVADPNLNGVPDSEEPWPGTKTASHQSASDQVPVEAQVISVNQTKITAISGGHQLDLEIFLDTGIETLYGFDPTALHITIDGAPYLGSWTRVGNKITIVDYVHVPDVPSKFQAIETFAENIDGTVGKVQVLYLVTWRFAVPYHQGSRVRVDGVVRSLGVDYIVDETRSFIQFLPDHFPQPSSRIDINIFKSDRLYICYNVPFAHDVSDGYDSALFKGFPYDSPATDTFVITVHNGGGITWEFFNSEPGTNKATLTDLRLVSNHPCTYTLTAVGPWTFRVTRDDVFVGYAKFKTAYTDDIISFKIDKTWLSYYANGHEAYTSYMIQQDVDSYVSFGTLPYDIGDRADLTEFFPSPNIKTEHGVVTDPLPPLHSPVRFFPLGVVKKKTTTHSLIGPQDYYIFEFDEIPPRGTYIEFRVEQAGQFNPWVNASFTEQFNIFEVMRLYDAICTNSNKYFGQFAGGDGYDDPSGLNFIAAADSPWPDEPTVPWWPLPYDVGPYDDTTFPETNKVKLFDPHCPRMAIEEDLYDEHAYDESFYDPQAVYAFVRDDMYMTVTFQDTLEERVRHTVTLEPHANFFQEPKEVNDLILHRENLYGSTVIVYYNGEIIVPDTLAHFPAEIRIGFNEAKTIAVQILDGAPFSF